MEDTASRETQIKALCLNLLSYREHSRQELMQKLTQKGFAADSIQPVLDELAAQGWQSDHRYAVNYARQRIEKGYGALRVRYELKQRGIMAVDLDDIVEEQAEGWLTLMEQTYHKKFVHHPTISRQEWAKRSRFLLQRGFSSAMINQLFKQLQLTFE